MSMKEMLLDCVTSLESTISKLEKEIDKIDGMNSLESLGDNISSALTSIQDACDELNAAVEDIQQIKTMVDML